MLGEDAGSSFIRIFAGLAHPLFTKYHLARRGRLALGVSPTLDVMSLLLKLFRGVAKGLGMSP